MKRFITCVMIAIVGITLLGCSKRKKNSNLNTGRSAWTREGLGSCYKENSSFSGVVYDVSQDAVKNFMSAVVNPTNVLNMNGNVSGEISSVSLKGRVDFTGGFDVMDGFPETLNNSTSNLEVLVIDGAIAPNSNSCYPSRNALRVVRYEVLDAENLDLVFEDAFGTVTLRGTLDGFFPEEAIFYGTIEFSNTRLWDGRTPGLAGELGWFEIPACEFFRCAR